MENLPKLVSERLKTALPKVHPDPDLLTAFAEHSLKGQERTQVLEHLSACADCRDIVSLAQPQQEDIVAPVVKKSTWVSFPVLRWGTAAALVVIVGGAVLLREQHRFAAAPTVSKIQSQPQPPPVPKSDAALYRADKDQVLNDRQEQVVTAKKELKKPAETRNEMVALSKSNVPGKPQVNDRKVSIPADLPLVSANVAASESGAQAAPTVPAPTGKLDAENSQPSASVPSASQSVEVTAAAPMITANEVEVSKAKEPLPKVDKDSGLPPEAVHSIGARAASTKQAIGGYVVPATSSFPRWTISPDGTLQRSIDSGKTWENVVVENQIFRAVATVGADVWAGGSSGLLYHSSDAGQQWTRIKPSAHGTSLTDDIARIEFTDHQHGKLTTTAGKAWSTSDAGQTWKKH
jgi:photosynthesis system II assembly factor YCF48-like protein/putative zinc finger protein